MGELKAVLFDLDGTLLDSSTFDLEPTRPMLDRVKEALFSVLEGYGAIRGRVLDLYAGWLLPSAVCSSGTSGFVSG